ncbi:mpv17-like protein isoform X2 [Bacillus rossius redtenbacheri]|uniref:mpv17-like protein isoform X2 n=1 Tax=Bacillus rossius redtenbacheri TaxID=93214 RepID=UPI002FDD8775
MGLLARSSPLVRGVAAYAVIWPVSSLCQQLIAGAERVDCAQAARFALYGSCFVAPSLQAWLSFAQRAWPGRSWRATLTKVLLEQVTYTPFAIASFYCGMTLLEGQGWDAAVSEVRAKFLPTYKVGALVWPAVQVFNYSAVPERNRVPFVSVCSLLWACFLAHMKQAEARRLARPPVVSPP